MRPRTKAREREMKNRQSWRVPIALALVYALTCTMPTAAYAYTGEDTDTTTLLTATEQAAPEEATETEPAELQDPVPLTPDGNLTLVDDISGEAATDKQFITVITKSGSYFYLVIDRAGNEQNVYFLNLVDEGDLMALLEEAGATTATAPAATEPEPVPVEPEPALEPEPESDSGLDAVLGIVALLALAGGGALFYIKVLKPKKSAATGRADISELDSYGYGADEGLDDLIAGDSYLGEPDDGLVAEPAYATDDRQEVED
jgi:hypothetical protein